VAKYGWRNVQVTRVKEVPNMVRVRIKAGTQVWYERKQRFQTVRVDKGNWAYRTVTKYRTERYVKYYRTTRERKRRYRYYRGRRIFIGYYYEYKRIPVYGWRQTPYTVRERYWKSNWVTEQRPDGIEIIRHEDPIYEWRMVQQGTKRIPVTTTERVWGVVGTQVKWELEKLPEPPAQPEPEPEMDFSYEQELFRIRTENYVAQQARIQAEAEPVLEPVPSILEDPLGWFQATLINTGRQDEGTRELLTNTLGPATDSLKSIADEERNPIIANWREDTLEFVENSVDGWKDAMEGAGALLDYTVDAARDGRWGDFDIAMNGWGQAVSESLDASQDATVQGAGMVGAAIITTPYRLVTQSIPNFARSVRERLDGEDRFWDVIFTGVMLEGDIAGTYGLARAVGLTDRINVAAQKATSPLYRNPADVAASRAAALQEALPPGSSGRVTMAAGVVEDTQGIRQVAIGTSESYGYIRPGVKALIEPDDIVVSGFNHAEQNIINCALQSELDLISIAAGRPICPTCFEEILKMVGTLIASQVK
jgi:hypothetical protein